MELRNPPLLVDGPAVDETYDIAYLTNYLGKLDTGIAFTDRAYLAALAGSAYSTLVLGNSLTPQYPGDGLAYTTSLAEYRRRDPLLHLVNGLGSFVSHLRQGYLPEHRAGHKVAIMHDEPQAFDFYSTDVWNRAHVRDTLMAAQDGFVFVSARSRDLWVEEAGLHDAPLHVLPNTCAEEALIEATLAHRDRADVARGLGIDPDVLNVVVVGTVQRRKAQLDVVDAVRRLRARRPDLPVHLRIVGRPREPLYGDELAAYVVEHDLADVVTVVGEVAKPQALAHIAAADVLVLASHTEAMPLVLLEAMLLRTPIVTTAVGGAPEMLGDGFESFVDVADVEAIAAQVERVGDDPAWARRSAAAAADRYWAQFSNARFRARFDEALAAMAADAGLASPPLGVPGGPVLRSGRPGALTVTGPVSGRPWRAALAARHAQEPLTRVKLAAPGAALVPVLAAAAPLARLGLAVAALDSSAGRVVCAPDDGSALVPTADVLDLVGRPAHEAAYAEHVRAAARRRARAKTLADAAAEPVPAAPAPASLTRRARRWARRVMRPRPPVAPVAPPVPTAPTVVMMFNSPMQLMAVLSLWDHAPTLPAARLVALVHSTNGAPGFGARLVDLCRRTGRFDAVVDITETYREVYAARPSVASVRAFGDRLRDAWGGGAVHAIYVSAYMSARGQKFLYETAGAVPVRLFEDGVGSYVPKSIKQHDVGLMDRVTSRDCAEARHIAGIASVDLMLASIPVPPQYDADLPRVTFPPVTVGGYRIDYAHFHRVLGAHGRAFAPDEVLLVAQNFADHLVPRSVVAEAERGVNDAVVAQLLAAGRRVVIRPHPRAGSRTWGPQWDDDPRVVVWDDEPMLPVEVLLDPQAPPALTVGATSSCLFYLHELTDVPVSRYPDDLLDVLRTHANDEHRWMMDLAAQVLPALDTRVVAAR
ncbi:glycosyltransferase [Cellulomonas sp. PhB150]|uniref:glycosyltransferase n=1 Tax=Cellulomonas sp. PhB150 TaxID=2485188 RepID=UPI000F489C36|nr:glycosyltransferase [Cellulomonas sp. PhB150]ROS28242.1 glycosyltransferase involved in cell wall biosynthesis [Cellulomonas sp. PhB150]